MKTLFASSEDLPKDLCFSAKHFLSTNGLDVVRTSALAVVRSPAASRSLAVTVVMAPTRRGPSLSMSRRVILTLDDDLFAATVVAFKEQCHQL